MSLSSTVSLGALRLLTVEHSDMENNPAISVAEWNGMISNSYKSLYDKLVAAYGNDYYVATPYQFTLTGAQGYALPSDFYKLLGVDLQYTGSPTGWVSLERFELIERNKSAYPNTQSNYSGYTNLKYRLSGSNIDFNMVPQTGQISRALYIPKPTSLIFMPSCALTIGSSTITTSDTSDLSVGMTIYGNGIIGIGSNPTTFITGILNSTTFTISAPANITQPIVTLRCWRDDTTIDGIAGWEEYIYWDCAIKSGQKQEDELQDLMTLRKDMETRIEGMAEGRDAGQAHHVSDVLSIQNGDGCGWGSGGYDGGW